MLKHLGRSFFFPLFISAEPWPVHTENGVVEFCTAVRAVAGKRRKSFKEVTSSHFTSTPEEKKGASGWESREVTPVLAGVLPKNPKRPLKIQLTVSSRAPMFTIPVAWICIIAISPLKKYSRVFRSAEFSQQLLFGAETSANYCKHRIRGRGNVLHIGDNYDTNKNSHGFGRGWDRGGFFFLPPFFFWLLLLLICS